MYRKHMFVAWSVRKREGVDDDDSNANNDDEDNLNPESLQIKILFSFWMDLQQMFYANKIIFWQ